MCRIKLLLRTPHVGILPIAHSGEELAKRPVLSPTGKSIASLTATVAISGRNSTHSDRHVVIKSGSNSHHRANLDGGSWVAGAPPLPTGLNRTLGCVNRACHDGGNRAPLKGRLVSSSVRIGRRLKSPRNNGIAVGARRRCRCDCRETRPFTNDACRNDVYAMTNASSS